MITFRSKARGIGAAMVWAVMIFNTIAYAQDYSASRIGLLRGGEISFEPTGPGVIVDALDPAVKKWYVPQELFIEYQWKQWEYTNYARDRYQRYVDITLEGDYFYDLYGSYITRGWLIYDWSQTQPQQSGSGILKTSRYGSFFSNLVIASDQKGQHHLAVTIGDDIRTTLTPMTFSKPAFNGIQIDLQSDKYEATALLARPSNTGGEPSQRVTSQTVLTGGRATAQLGDFVQIGVTYVNVHNSMTLLESFKGSPRSGSLAETQNSNNITKLFLRLLDDSPEDFEGGAALFSWDLIIEADIQNFDEEGNLTTIEREVFRASKVGSLPSPEGGFQRKGFWEASGPEQIDLEFDLRSYTGFGPSEIKKVTFEVVVGNDYRIEVSSDRQLDRLDKKVYLLAARAEGNTKDSSNLKLLRIDYGLPTGTEIYGVTLEANDLLGFDIYAEFDRSRSYRQYPNRRDVEHETASDEGDGWMVNISKIDYPWFLLGEAYSMDHNYNTSAFLARGDLEIDYNNIQQFTYELVDDNDDQDRFADWERRGESLDREVFPGFDENQDFISDFNQNNSRERPNAVPDYDEPFLRYGTDRREFLFGIDMNNNLWVDRFENDDDPDFPYDRDHRGYNAYVGLHVTPDVRVMIGQNREDLLAGDRDNLTTYALFTLDKDFPALGRLKIFENFRLAKDNIEDDLRQWDDREVVGLFGRAGANVSTPDPLAAQDTWINSAFVSFDYTKKRNLNIISKLKFDVWNQRAERPGLRDEFTFFGLINKVDYTFKIGVFDIQPRIKNELRIEAPALKSDPRRRENTLILFLIAKLPFLDGSEIETGVEYMIFRQMRPEDILVREGLLDDFTQIVGAVQFSNLGDYLGYKLITQLGLSLNRRFIPGDDPKTGSSAFVTVYAGVQE